MNETQERTPRECLRQLGMLPDSGDAEREALYAAALDGLDLTPTDYLTIRDLLSLGGIGKDAALEMALIALFVARGEGSLCVRLDADSLSRRLPEFPEREALGERFLAQLAAGAYDEGLVGRTETAFKPLIVRGEFLYFQRYLRDELLLLERLRHRLATAPLPDAAERERVQAALEAVLNQPPNTAGGAPLRLNGEQQTALALSLLRDFVVITGGPGTGKTAILVAVLRCLARLGVPVERIALTAPTGRAAQRMSEALRQQLDQLPAREECEAGLAALTGQTIHRLLGYSPSRNTFTYDGDNPLPVDAVLVDEVSMIDVELMARLLAAIPDGARILLLGDSHQLPSVEAGAVLADLAPGEREPAYSAAMAEALRQVLPEPPALSIDTAANAGQLRDRVARLTQSHRSGPAILRVAALVNTYDDSQEEALFAALRQSDACAWEDAQGETRSDWLARLDQWAARYYLGDYRTAVRRCILPERLAAPCDDALREVFRGLQAAKILAVVREGSYGCEGINAYLAERVRARLDPGRYGRYFAGAPILITRNDYALELFNGDIGVVLRDAAGGYRVAFPRGEQALLVPPDSLPEHEFAFAVTVHKSQGSEYEHVLLALPPADSAAARRLLTREILYTGLTRARQSARIHASRAALLKACRGRVQRDSGISLWS